MKALQSTLARKLAILALLCGGLVGVQVVHADHEGNCCSSCNSEYVECVNACTDPANYDQCYHYCEMEFMGCICCCDPC